MTPPTPAGLHQALEEAEAAAAALPHPERHGLDGCHGCHLERALAKLRVILAAGADGETPTMKERFAAYLLTDSYLNSAIRERVLRHFERAAERGEGQAGDYVEGAPLAAPINATAGVKPENRPPTGSGAAASPASPVAGERERMVALVRDAWYARQGLPTTDSTRRNTSLTTCSPTASPSVQRRSHDVG